MANFQVIDGGMQDLFTTTGLPVVHAKFLGKALLSWQELFSGFEAICHNLFSGGKAG